VIAALRRRADVLEADAKAFRNDPDVTGEYVQTVGAERQVTPVLLRFFASQLRALADEAEGRGALEPDKRGGEARS
jgi:hypothetical protein